MKYLSKIQSNIQQEIAEKEPFNEEVIYFRKNENVESLLKGIFKSLESIEGVKLKKCEMKFDDTIYEFREISDKRKKDRDYFKTDIERSRFMKIHVVVEITDSAGEKAENELTLLYPELVDDQYFYISNNKYFPVFQLVDAEFYRAGREAIVLKTLFMPLRINGKKKDVLSDMNGDLVSILKGRTMYLELFRAKRVTTILFYLAKMGMTETLNYLNLSPHMEIVDIIDEDDPLYYYFHLNRNLKLKVKREWIEEDNRYRNSMVLTMQDLFKNSRTKFENISDHDFWRKSLGEKFIRNTLSSVKLEKCHTILVSFDRIMDSYTKKILRLDAEDKKDTISVVKYMMENYESICRMDPHHLDNKRVRITEHLLYPLAEKISRVTYRMVNFKENQRTMTSLKGMFTGIPEEFLIKSIITNPLMRYSNSVNTIDLLSRNLKASKTGAQSSTNKSSPSVTTKSINSSYVGKADLVATSSNEPGISFSLVPMTEIYDPEKEGMFFFSEKPLIEEFNVRSFEEDDNEAEIEDVVEVEIE